MQAKSLQTPAQTDKMLERITKGNFNAVFVNVFAYGHAYYDSKLVTKEPTLDPTYNPLAYFIEKAHQRGIKVHVWLVAGPVGGRKGVRGPILTQHPEWSMVGPDGKQSTWLNYNRADVRAFISDIALDLVTHYEIDGVHFDYTRYPGAAWTFDPYTVQAFAEAYNRDLNILRYAKLPAYATFSGNALSGVNTAQVLAMFDNSRPAILFNHYGAGEVFIFNWDATERQIAANSEMLQRSINDLTDGGNIYIFRSEINDTDDFAENLAWLKDIGQPVGQVTEVDIPALSAADALIMPNIYRIPPQTASSLATFVQQGGGVIFIDGPTSSIKDKNIQAITGMHSRSGHFQETAFLVPTGSHPLIPVADHNLAITDYQALEREWNTFRKQGISQLLKDVYQRTKQLDPDVLVTITVSGNPEKLAEYYFLDWQQWLKEGYVDLLIPRAYVDDDEPLGPIIATWQSALENSDRITLGLIDYSRQQKEVIPKAPDRLLSEIELSLNSHSQGIVIFDIESLDENTLEALADIFPTTLNTPSN